MVDGLAARGLDRPRRPGAARGPPLPLRAHDGALRAGAARGGGRVLAVRRGGRRGDALHRRGAGAGEPRARARRRVRGAAVPHLGPVGPARRRGERARGAARHARARRRGEGPQPGRGLGARRRAEPPDARRGVRGGRSQADPPVGRRRGGVGGQLRALARRRGARRRRAADPPRRRAALQGGRGAADAGEAARGGCRGRRSRAPRRRGAAARAAHRGARDLRVRAGAVLPLLAPPGRQAERLRRRARRGPGRLERRGEGARDLHGLAPARRRVPRAGPGRARAHRRAGRPAVRGVLPRPAPGRAPRPGGGASGSDPTPR